MLSFFRKYEKTFFLIVFLPAIIGMGVTSVIVTVLTQKPESSPGKVFDEPIALQEWQSVIGPYNKLMGRSEDGQDSHFRFFAYSKAAEKAGIRVSDAEVADKTIEIVGREIARRRAAERIRDSGVDPQTDEGRRKFTTYFFEEMSQMRKNFTDHDYETFLKAVGMTMQEYEGHQRRALMMEKLEHLYRDAATVSPEEIWKDLKEKGQKREAEVVALEGTAYIPSAGTVPTDLEIKAYYETHKALYDEPKRVAVEYVAAPFEKTKAELAAPLEDALKGFYEAHKHEYTAFVGTVAVVQSYSDCRDKVLEKFQTQQSKEVAQNLLEQVATKLDAQRKAGKIDMRAAVDAVAAANTKTQAIVTGVTPLLEPEDFFSHPLLGGFSANFWVQKEPASATRTSDPLKGEKSVAILRTADVKEKKVPTYDEVKEQVKKDYVAGGERELKKFYQENQWKYRTKDKWKFEVVFANYERYAKEDPNIEAPTPEQTIAFWNDKHATLWAGQDAAKVGSDAIALAYKAEKSKDRVQRDIKALQTKCQESYNEHKRADLDLNKSGAAGRWDYETLSLDREELLKDARLSVVATAIPLARKDEPSEVFERADGKGKFFFVLKEKIEQKVPDLAEIKDTVAKDVLAARGFERARAAAEKLVAELRDLKGDQVAAALKERGLTSVKTGVFARNTTTLPNVPSEGAQIAAETFNCEPNGGFEKTVSDDLGKKIYLVRCAQRQDPSEDSMTASDRQLVRRDLLKNKRQTFVTQKMTDLTLRAKGVSDEHVKWVRERRDGPQGRVGSKVRQIFVPNDKATLEGWLEDAARKRIDEALAKLKADTKWERVCLDYSEDEATKARGGEMTVTRGDLADQYGYEFESKLFELPADGQVSVPLKSKKGLHLVKVVKAPTAGSPDEMNHGTLRMTFRHIMVKTDAKTRNLPTEISDKARALAKKKIEDAKARIEKGEAFSKVAAEVGAEDDSRAKGEAFNVPYLSTVMLKTLELPVEQTTADIAKLEPFEVKVGNATEWHVALCARDPADREPGFRAAALAPRIVFECVASSKETLLTARRELETWAKERPDHDATAGELLKQWKKIVHRYSTAETGKKEGAFGAVAVDPALRGYDLAALSVLCTLDAGKRSDVVETKDGFHYVECLTVETKPADDVERTMDIAQSVLRGTDWTEN